ncbi:hypothetical protein LZ554_003933 [Drepanopeziza brunnea f. sp. 'monogermtubi']|nr:hypothetical protein LZ554_003933 [Drepanopeziza brunnea f. sp. 'monogermtubi']
MSNTPQGVHLTYELPHRVHTAKAYPLLSSNGSSVILYGHENGVKIIWRGGRKFKPQQTALPDHQKTNGASNSGVISLDSDDDETPEKKPFDDKPEFEDHEEELNPSRPYPGVLQELDLWFGTDVFHLAILPPTVLKADGPSWQCLEPLKQKIVFAASCADNYVRLVNLPLTPPSPASKARSELRSDFTLANAGNGTWGETVTLLSGHRKPSDGVSMTADFGPATIESRRFDPQIVVASHSRELTGLLLLWRVPVKAFPKSVEPFQSVSLYSPAKSITFNSSISKQYASHLLVAESVGICRIYDYKLLVRPNEDPSEVVVAEQGTWLLSLYTSFQNIKNDPEALQHNGLHAGFGRKTIVDAKWVSGGRAIIVLLNDGEWAIWDIEGVGPGAPQGLIGRQGIKGGSKSQYSLTGYIDGAVTPRASGQPQIPSSKFVPMTPGTRKSADPFSGRSNGAVRGEISVSEVRSSSPSTVADESVLFWLGETYTIIPNLAKYWAANAQKTGGGGSLFNGPAGARMTKIENISLLGERCSGIEQIAKTPNSTGFSTDILVLGEHRYMLLLSGKPARESSFEKSIGRLALAETRTNGGELDVMGIEQALANMENRESTRKMIF